MHRVISWLMLSVTALKETPPKSSATPENGVSSAFFNLHHAIPGGSSEQVLGVGCCRVDRQALRRQQQLAGGHGDVFQAPDDLHLVVLFLKKDTNTL